MKQELIFIVALVAVGALVVGCPSKRDNQRWGDDDRDGDDDVAVPPTQECVGEATPTPNWNQCADISASRINGSFLGLCPDDDILIDTQQQWDTFVDDCLLGNTTGLPTIDWATKQVMGIGGFISCPFAGMFRVLGAQQCGTTIEAHIWLWSDWCWCDYFDQHLDLYVVDRGTITDVVRVEHQEAGCAAVTCDCGWGPEQACFTAGACDTLWECIPTQIDGLPPNWP